MNRYLKLKGKIEFHKYDSNSWSVDIEILPMDLVSIYMEIQLISFMYAQSCKLESNNSEIIVLSLYRDNNRSLAKKSGREYNIRLSRNDIDLISSHLLLYYRDSLAAVDHIDVDITGIDKLSQNGTLVIKTPQAFAPMSSKDAKKILGLQ